ncbi:MAG: peptidoglycan bridge formation glycyltransferase FemA/FemB family protein [Patescibacteria group bacterium]
MNKFKFQELKEEENFDPQKICKKNCEDVPFTQSNFYGNWQKKLGRVVRRFLIYSDNEIIAYFQIIKYPLLFKKNYLYIPYGPVVKDFFLRSDLFEFPRSDLRKKSDDFFINLKQKLTEIAKTENAIFVRLDFTPFISNDILSKFFTKAKFFTYRSAHFQPRTEWLVNLEESEENLLKAMHEKTRYSIHLAERKGITAEIITENFEKYFEIFYKLISETAQRDKFNLHPKNYYENIFHNLSQNLLGKSFLTIVKHEQNPQILAINLIIVFGKTATHIFSGSSDEKKSLRPTYLARWKAMCYAKKIGCTYSSFGGIASQKNNIYKSWEGLTTFKKRFGGQELNHSDFFDVVVNPIWYFMYNVYKIMR